MMLPLVSSGIGIPTAFVMVEAYFQYPIYGINHSIVTDASLT
jgi:hypothetical protein